MGGVGRGGARRGAFAYGARANPRTPATAPPRPLPHTHPQHPPARPCPGWQRGTRCTPPRAPRATAPPHGRRWSARPPPWGRQIGCIGLKQTCWRGAAGRRRWRGASAWAGWGGRVAGWAVRVPPHPPPIPQACTRAPACRYVVHTAAAVETSSRHPERIIQPAVMGVSKQGVGWIEQRPSLTGSRAAQLPSCLPRFAALPSTARGPTLPPHPLRPSTTAAQAAHVLGAVNRTPSVQRVVMTSSVAAVFNSSNPRGHVYTGGVHMSGGCGGGWGGGRGGVENPRTPHPTLRDAPAPSACGHPPLPPPPHMMARRGGLEPGD